MIDTTTKSCGSRILFQGEVYQCYLEIGHEGKCLDQIKNHYKLLWQRRPGDARYATKAEHDAVVNGRRLCSGKECLACEKNRE